MPCSAATTKTFVRFSSQYFLNRYTSTAASILDMLNYFVSGVLLMIPPLYFIYKPPRFLIRCLQRKWPDVLFHVPTPSNVVALTIDDCPSDYTDEIQEILDVNNARATFFVIGAQVAGYREQLQRLLHSGHELGNHAMYDEPSRSLAADTLRDQLRSVESMLDEAYRSAGKDIPPRYFRPGSGFFNDRVRNVAKELGYKLVLGNIYPHDPHIPSSRINASHVLSMLQPGSIIICHDRRAWTAPMLRIVLPEIKKRGYSIVSLTELLKRTATT